jgi:hypothetical protein
MLADEFLGFGGEFVVVDVTFGIENRSLILEFDLRKYDFSCG